MNWFGVIWQRMAMPVHPIWFTQTLPIFAHCSTLFERQLCPHQRHSPRILLHNATTDGFREAAPRRRRMLSRQLWAEAV
ncbi:hypothetical protein EOW65_19700 [Sinirhodobacter ferrireducens]|uniref:Uncharacterized protein n=1 Tax=Paenirhodobacter ferrireducens TaxID=1215032 RepID=A0A443L3U5_9RHOB|nr:hypothetical protein [Sinirhodobacter ferrireducens]RWR43850.1 hypothetical protein EOW65_19700 [Sinirhodobacter ferrireducens]